MNATPAAPSPGRTATVMMASLFGLALSNLFVRSSMGVLAPELAADLALSPVFLGAAASAFFFAYAIFQVPGGMLLDRFGPRRTITGLFALNAIGVLAFSFAPDGRTMLAARIIMGIGCAAIFPGAFMAISRFYPPDRLTSVAGVMNSFAMIGMFLATFPFAYLVTAIGWREGFRLVAIVVFALTAFAWFAIRDRPAGGEGKAASSENLRQILAGAGQSLRVRHVLKIAAGGIALSTGSVFLGLWGGPYLNDVHGLSETERGEALMYMAFAGVAGHFAFGKLARRFNTLKGMVLFGSGLAAAISAAFALLADPSRSTVTVLFAALGFACGFPSILLAHARAIMPDRLIGRGVAVVNTGVMISIALMQTAVGAVIGLGAGDVPDAGNYRLAFGFLAVMAFVSFMIYTRVEDRPPRG